MLLFRKLKEVNCKVLWVYEKGDETMLEAGQDYNQIVSELSFDYYEKPE